MIKIKSKKAGIMPKAVTFLPKFFLLVIFLFFLTGLLSSFYSRQYDVRAIESSLVTKELVDCYLKNGFDKTKIMSCLGVDGSENDFYINMKLENFEKTKEIKIGREFLSSLCGIKRGNVPSCLKEEFIFNENEKLKVFLVILKLEKNV